MSTDKDYASFLEKANQETSSSKATTSTTNEAQIKLVDTEIPPALKDVKKEYISTSETEADFKPVALKWSGKGDFSIAEFRKLVGLDEHGIEISQMKIEDWDSRGEYKTVVTAVKSVGAEAKVFMTQDHTRLEYWVLAVDREGGRVVGLRVWSIES